MLDEAGNREWLLRKEMRIVDQLVWGSGERPFGRGKAHDNGVSKYQTTIPTICFASGPEQSAALAGCGDRDIAQTARHVVVRSW
jgi:hypothetical protein